MSPQEPERGDPTPEWPGKGHDDGGTAAAEGPGQVPPAWDRPWAPPAGQVTDAAQQEDTTQQEDTPQQKDTAQQTGTAQHKNTAQEWAAGQRGQQAPGWEERRAWQQQSPPQPQPWQEHGPYPDGNVPYRGGTPSGTPYGGQPYNGSPHNGPSYAGSPYGSPPYPSPYAGAAPYGASPHGASPYGAAPHGASPYGASPYGQPRYVAPPKPGIIPLRPLMFGEILDGSFQALRRNAKAMLGAGLLAQSLSAILAAVLTGVVATSSGSIEAWAKTASRTDVASLGIGLMAGFAVLSILSVFMSVVLQGAMVVPVARSVLNRPTGFRRMVSLVRSRIGALIRLAAVLVAAAVAAMALFFTLIVLLLSNVRGAAALLVIPLMMGFVVLFLWVAVKLMVAPAAVVIEELGAIAGLSRSWALTRANWWRILGITLVAGILVAVITQVVLIPASLLPTVLSGVVSPHGGSGQDATLTVAIGIITAVVGALVGAVGYAFQTSVMALLYMDLRMRKDGLDIALLRGLETGADPDGIPGRNAEAGRTPFPGHGTAPGAWPYGR